MFIVVITMLGGVFLKILKCETGFTMFEVMFVTVIFVLVGFIFSPLVLFNPKYSEDENYKFVLKDTYSILALQDNVNSEGVFYLGSGSVEGKQRYHYFYPGELGYKSDSVPSNLSEVIEEENVEPRIEVFTGEYIGDGFNLLTPTKTKYHIYVPIGSVKLDYQVDLK